MRAMEISRTGLDVEWRRLEVIAENLANVGTTRTASGQLYRAQRLVSGPRRFAEALAGEPAVGGVAVYGVEASGEAAGRRVYEPGHPDADASGFVTYPNVDATTEMALLVRTARAYEANIVAMNAARQMYAKAMELGKRS